MENSITNHTPSNSVISFSLFISGLLLIFIYSIQVGVFKNPDEGAHYLRAYEVAHGHWFNTKNNIGTFIKCDDYITIAKKYAPIAYYQEAAEQGGNECNVKSINSASTYPPTAYLILAIAISIGDTYDLSIENTVLLARLLNGLFCFSLIFLSITNMPSGRYPMYAILFSPMLMVMLSAISADGITIAMSFCFFSILAKAIFRGEARKTTFALILLVSAIIGTTKIIYCLLCFSYIATFTNKFNMHVNRYNIKTLLLAITPGLIAVGSSILNMMYADKSMIYLGNGAQPLSQIYFILHNPISFIKVIFDTITTQQTLNQIFTPIHLLQSQNHFLWFMIFIFVFMAWVILLVTEKNRLLNFSSKVILSVLFVLSIVMTILPLYMTYTPPGYHSVLGVQGRYFLPILAIVTFLISSNSFFKKMSQLKVRSIFLAAIVMTNFFIVAKM